MCRGGHDLKRPCFSQGKEMPGAQTLHRHLILIALKWASLQASLPYVCLCSQTAPNWDNAVLLQSYDSSLFAFQRSFEFLLNINCKKKKTWKATICYFALSSWCIFISSLCCFCCFPCWNKRFSKIFGLFRVQSKSLPLLFFMCYLFILLTPWYWIWEKEPNRTFSVVSMCRACFKVRHLMLQREYWISNI